MQQAEFNFCVSAIWFRKYNQSICSVYIKQLVLKALKLSKPSAHLLVTFKQTFTPSTLHRNGLGLHPPITLVETALLPCAARNPPLVIWVITHLHKPPFNDFQTGCLEQAMRLCANAPVSAHRTVLKCLEHSTTKWVKMRSLGFLGQTSVSCVRASSSSSFFSSLFITTP